MKKYKIILTVLVTSLVFAQASQALNLKQKKLKQKAEKTIESHKKDIQKKCGCLPKIDIAWDNLQTRDDFFIPSRSLSSAKDAMGRLCKNFKKEVCAGVKTIHLYKGDLHKSFSNGVLKLGRKIPNQGWGGQQIAEMLEEKL